jgi:hypothetical protein
MACAVEMPSGGMIWYKVSLRWIQSSNIKLITPNISESAVLVLLMGGFMKYAFEMALGSKIKIGSGIQKLIGGYKDTRGHTHTHISLLYFFKIRKVQSFKS